MFFKRDNVSKDKSILTEYESDLLMKAREMTPGEPPKPWGNLIGISAAGVLSGGWTEEENYVLISSDGYSIINPRTGEKIERNRDSESTLRGISKDNLKFVIPSTNELIDIYGISAGDGIRGTDDGWVVELIYPWWPRTTVMLKNYHVPDALSKGYLDGAYILDIPRLDGWLRTGFSPSGNYLSVLGSAGVIIFTNTEKCR